MPPTPSVFRLEFRESWPRKDLANLCQRPGRPFFTLRHLHHLLEVLPVETRFAASCPKRGRHEACCIAGNARSRAGLCQEVGDADVAVFEPVRAGASLAGIAEVMFRLNATIMSARLGACERMLHALRTRCERVYSFGGNEPSIACSRNFIATS